MTTLLQSEVFELFSKHPSVSAKFLFDLSNGKFVVEDHLSTKAQRGSFGSRIFDSITGRGHERDLQIQRRLQEQITATTNLLIDHENALTQINNGQYLLAKGISSLVTTLNKTMDEIVDLQVSTLNLSRSIDSVVQKINKQEFLLNAMLHQENILSKLKNFNFDQGALLEQLFFVVDELYWGAFGAYISLYPNEAQSESLIDTTKNLLKQTVSDLLKSSGQNKMPPMELMKISLISKGANEATSAMIRWLGDWCTLEKSPICYFATEPSAQPGISSRIPLIFYPDTPLMMLEESLGRNR